MTSTTLPVQQQSVQMRRFVTILWSAALILVLLERFSAAAIALFSSGFAGAAARHFGCQAVSAFPELLYVLALWWVREALSAFARGELFGPPITRMLDRVGLVIATASFLRIFVVPGACRLLGFNAGHWIAFDAAAMVLGAIGLAFKAIAVVLRHASAIQSELDEIF